MSAAPTPGGPVPVALFVYRRHRQLPRTLECLRQAGAERLYVFSDGPAESGAREDVELVRALVRGIDWAEVTLLEQPGNLGLSRSIQSGLDSVFERHETAIVIEDDVCVAPEFCRYACLALAHYGGEPRIAGITGLRLPFDRAVLGGYEFDVFLSPRFSSWAWATWRERWRELSFDPAELRRRIAAAEDFSPQRAGDDLPAMIHDAILAETLGGSWDVACATNMILNQSWFVTPTWNMVENSGLQEGTHADGPPGFDLAWEPDAVPGLDRLRFAPIAADERVLRAYRRFFAKAGAGPGPFGRPRQLLARWAAGRRLRALR